VENCETIAQRFYNESAKVFKKTQRIVKTLHQDCQIMVREFPIFCLREVSKTLKSFQDSDFQTFKKVRDNMFKMLKEFNGGVKEVHNDCKSASSLDDRCSCENIRLAIQAKSANVFEDFDMEDWFKGGCG
jgi:hypothetical protein